MEIAHGPVYMQPDGLMHNGTSPTIQVRRMGAEDIESCHRPYANNKDADQPVHQCNLISIYIIN